MGASSSVSSEAKGAWGNVWSTILANRYGSLEPLGSCRRVLFLGTQGGRPVEETRGEDDDAQNERASAACSSSAQMDIDTLPEVPAGCVRLTLISDTHERHARYEIPACDILIHCGDILASSRFAPETHAVDVIQDFSAWLARTPCQHRVVIPGNHDIGITALGPERIKELLPTANFLEFETLELPIQATAESKAERPTQVSIYGAPLSYGKSPNRQWQGLEAQAAMERNMPEKADIVVTHGPAKHFILDALARLRPKLHAHGHVHRGYGQVRRLGEQGGGCISVNAAMMHPKHWIQGQRAENLPIVIDLDLSRQADGATTIMGL